MIEAVDITKIIFNPLNKNYSIHFNTLTSRKYFNYLVSADNAKKISMSSEGISSILLSPYELYIDLLDSLKMRISKILFYKQERKLLGKIILVSKSNDCNEFTLNVTDAIILSLKTYSTIYIDSDLLQNQEFQVEEKILIRDKRDNSNNLKKKLFSLERAMNESIKSEFYETAAFLRDRINNLKDVI